MLYVTLTILTDHGNLSLETISVFVNEVQKLQVWPNQHFFVYKEVLKYTISQN